MLHDRVRSFLQLLGTNAITKVCWALTLLLLLRVLGAQSFGFLATLWSAATIAGGFADLGTGQAVLRNGSRDHNHARQLAAQSMRLQLALTLLLATILFVGGWMLLPPTSLSSWQRVVVIALGVLTPLVDRFQSLFTVCSQIGGNYAAYSRIRSAYFLALTISIAFVLLCHGGLLAISVTYFAVTVLFAGLMARSTWSLLPSGQATLRTLPMRSLIAQGLPFVSVTALALAYGRLEVTILGSWGQTAAAGAFHIIYQIVLLVYSVSGMFFTVVYPRLYRHRSDREALTTDFRDTVRWLSLLAWMTAPPLMLFAESLLRLMGGSTLVAYAPLLRTLDLMLLLMPGAAALNFLLPLDRMGVRVGCDVLGIAITLGGSIYAAASGRPVLAAAAEVCGYGCSILVAHVVVHRRLIDSSRALLSEFFGTGLRAAPAILLAWLVPAPWWIGVLVFVLTFSMLLATTQHPICARVRLWLANTPS